MAYPDLDQYGYISDCSSAALVSTSGSMDWCCMPCVDSRSFFCRILDWEKGGYCSICPTGNYESSRRYIGNSLVLETTFKTESGSIRIIDAFLIHSGEELDSYNQILRIAEGITGKVQVNLELIARFDHGSIKPWIRKTRNNNHIIIGGNDGLLISGNFPLEMIDRHNLACTDFLKQGQRKRLSITWRKPEDFDRRKIEPPDDQELDQRMQKTLDWWESWSSQCTMKGPYESYIIRSSLVLKGLSNISTGAIAAAPTTSLPETMGGARNWDYRFSWIRDACFTVRALERVGYCTEADEFRKFIERSAAGRAEDLQVYYGINGDRRIREINLEYLEGYKSSKPVRIGNAAKNQVQLDMLGQLLDLAWEWHARGRSPDKDYWEFLKEIVDKASHLWKEPGQGIWEYRTEGRHFVHSKMMCWVALDRGIKLAKELGLKAPVIEWERSSNELRKEVEDKGYDKKRGVFIQAFEHPVMDSSLLLMPMFGFLDYRDPRMIRTTDAVRDELEENGLLYRYPPGDDGMEGKEGTFIACTFWLAQCLAFQGRTTEAKKTLEKALFTGNDLGLFSEEYEASKKIMLGNFPQGLSHLSLINALNAISELNIE